MKVSPMDVTLRIYTLRKLPLLAALLCSLASAQAAGPSSTAPATTAAPAQHPIVGTWTWTLPGKQCAETWQYRANGTWLGTSGEEVTQGDYEIPSKPGLLGFYQVVETVTNGNGKRDCSGDLHEASDERVTRFIQFSPKLDQFIVCKAESLQACFGPLKRVPG
jgi:hypothetical protein